MEIDTHTGKAIRLDNPVDRQMDREKMLKACRDFEAMLTTQMLKVMRKSTGLKEEGITKGANLFQDMFEWELSRKISQDSPLGIAKAIMRQLGYDDIDEADRYKVTHDKALGRYELNSMIERAAGRHNLDPALIGAVIACESGDNPYAVSRRGAKGLMQLMDETAREYGVYNPFNPQQNINGGTTYLRDLLDRYNGDLRLAIAAYNAGPTAVDTYGGIPPYPETEDYVDKVLTEYKNRQDNDVVQK